MIQDGSYIEGVSLSMIVTVGLLCIQAVVTPVLLVFTSPATITIIVTAILTLIYPALVCGSLIVMIIEMFTFIGS